MPVLRLLTRDDFPLLGRWLAAPHVLRWWNHDPSPRAMELDFGPCIDRVDPTQVYIASEASHPFGLVQRYTFADNPGYDEELSALVEVPQGAFSIDYFVGEAAMLRKGWGAAMLRAIAGSIWTDHADASAIVVPVSAANTASWRVLERVGFRRVAQGPLTPDNPVDDRLHFVYRLDRPA